MKLDKETKSAIVYAVDAAAKNILNIHFAQNKKEG